MIQLKCIYCGQDLTAQEDERGQKSQCPKCNHDCFIPKTTTEKPAVSPDIAYVRDEDWAELYKTFFPAYDELSLFLMAFTLIMLFIANTTLQEQIHNIMEFGGLFVYLVAVILLCGFGLSIYHFYTSRQKTDVEKGVMFIFALFTNICTAVVAGIYTLRQSSGWVIIFPVWNLINAMLMVLMNVHIVNQHCTTIYRYCITDRQASYHQIMLSLTAVFLIFIFCNFVFNLYWAVTFSICIVYTTSFDKALQSIFPSSSHQSEEQSF
jgi:DNA-directed RNA polymerase subunit RPC12/RpoP